MSEVVGLYYSGYDDSVQAQITRDLIVLVSEFGTTFAVNDEGNMLPKSVIEDLELTKDGSPPTLAIRYKTGAEWPPSPPNIETVDRDLCPPTSETSLTTDTKIGYYLRPQGRLGPNLTERYLNRSYPRGRGVVDPLVVLVWGRKK